MDPSSLPHRHLLGMVTQLLICLTKRLLHISTRSSGECYEISCLNILCLLHEAILGHFILEVVYEGQCGGTVENRTRTEVHSPTDTQSLDKFNFSVCQASWLSQVTQCDTSYMAPTYTEF